MNSDRDLYTLRAATLQDIPQLNVLIDASVRTLHKDYYTPAQIAGALKAVYGVDTQVVNDGNYFIVEATSSSDKILVACGGWSFRSTLFGADQYNAREDNLLDPSKDAAKIRAFFVHPDWVRRGVGGIVLTACEDAARAAGFAEAEMGSTLAGVAFYQKKGYAIVDGGKSFVPVGQDGEEVVLEIIKMAKPL